MNIWLAVWNEKGEQPLRGVSDAKAVCGCFWIHLVEVHQQKCTFRSFASAVLVNFTFWLQQAQFGRLRTNPQTESHSLNFHFHRVDIVALACLH